ncbi:cistern family PEP-CTERM protein [Kamptonema formosum]|uniref:cistern family PEP-CTERM protein n=1 Tax=Kamptonema formosum TaxID=331992 RepID=UPI001E52E1A4|nr:cistern family PEP-CTERM protein [Oscillatoria sp. PCC 10802]
MAAAPSAAAFTFLNSGSGVGISADDLNKTFSVNFDGNVATQNVTGLTSEATFKFLGFNTVNLRSGTRTEAAFEITLSNTTSAPLLSRTSALGFDVWNFNGTSTGSGLALQGIGNSSDSGDTRSIGLFVNDRSGAFPNQFGDVDVCFTNGNTCQGGTSGGVDNNPTTDNPQTGTFTATLAFSGSVDKFALNNFGVRYQSIEGTSLGTSGTGQGTAVNPSTSESSGPRQIPEPGTVGALLLMGAGMLHKSRRKQPAVSQPQLDL